MLDLAAAFFKIVVFVFLFFESAKSQSHRNSSARSFAPMFVSKRDLVRCTRESKDGFA